MAAVSNQDLAQQLGRVQGSLEYLMSDAERARTDRGRMFERVDRAESAAAEAARAAAAAVIRIEAMQKHISEQVTPTIEKFHRLELKAAGVVVTLVFIGSILSAAVTAFWGEIKKAVGFG